MAIVGDVVLMAVDVAIRSGRGAHILALLC